MPSLSDETIEGWYQESSCETYFDFLQTPVNSDLVLYAGWLDGTNETDTDGDGVPDVWEKAAGLDPNISDTDGDGVSDFDEVWYYGTDPQVSDATSLTGDYDGDGLSDYEEIFTYGTNPLKSDTDGDFVYDGTEVELGTDPLTVQDSFFVSRMCETEGAVNASVEVNLSGEQVESLVITAEKGYEDLLPEHVGDAFSFEVNGDITSATIRFELDESLFDEADFDPVICYVNPKDFSLEELPTIREGNQIYTVTTHFSTYCIKNRKIYATRHGVLYVDDRIYDSVEVVFAINGSPELKNADDNYLTDIWEIMRHFPTDCGWYTYCISYGENSTGSYAKSSSFWMYPHSLSEIEWKENLGGYTLTNLLSSAIYQFGNDGEENKLRMIILMSAGHENEDLDILNITGAKRQIIEEAHEKNIKIYSIGYGDMEDDFSTCLKSYSSLTGGHFYSPSKAENISQFFEGVSRITNIDYDSDMDGLPDVVEDNLYKADGTKLKMDKHFRDMDRDGLSDGAEVSYKTTFSDDGKWVYFEVDEMRSNPFAVDSDHDGLEDGRPVIYDGKVIAPKDDEPWERCGLPDSWKEQYRIG